MEDEEKEESYWRPLDDTLLSAHYSIVELKHEKYGMDALRAMFPEGKANSLNFVLFSTSGVHGTYATIELVEAEAYAGSSQKDEDICRSVTFLIVHPRLVCLRYGNCEPKTKDDFAFLKKLRASSHAVVAKIGMEK